MQPNIAPTPSSLEAHRQHFPALRNKLYFNYGGQGPLPQPALTAIADAYQHMQEIGPFTGAAGIWTTQQVEQCRLAIATELQVAPTTITLTDSVSTGCNIGLWGLNWQAGDHLLLTDCEHPSVIATAQQLRRRFGIEFSACPILDSLNTGDPAAIIAQHLRPQTRMLALSHVLWNTGHILPLDQITQVCRRLNPDLFIMVDAAQSIGVLPLNLSQLDIDCYAFTGHKWWCGPDGLGGLYIRPQTLDRLEPTYMGWRGVQTDPQGQPIGWHADGRRYEIATSAYPLFAGLTTALSTLNQWGTATDRYQRIQTLSQQLWQQLNALPQVTCLHHPLAPAGLISFQVAGQAPKPLVQALEQHNIMVRYISHPQCIRACTHYLTLDAELTQFIEILTGLIS